MQSTTGATIKIFSNLLLGLWRLLNTKTEQIFRKKLSQIRNNKIKQEKPAEAGYTSHYF